MSQLGFEKTCLHKNEAEYGNIKTIKGFYRKRKCDNLLNTPIELEF